MYRKMKLMRNICSFSLQDALINGYIIHELILSSSVNESVKCYI
jgi:hypothetical protein